MIIDETDDVPPSDAEHEETEFDCEECDASGTDEDGSMCQNCDGTGTIWL